MKRVAILGGGPAGAYAAECLSLAGLDAVLFDEKLAWEKPCGGGVTFKAWNRYPFLFENGAAKQTVDTAWLSAKGVENVRMDLDRPILIYSRKDLNRLLLERAQAAGAQIEKTRVLSMDRSAAGWRITTKSGVATADYCIVATGARNSLAGTGTEFKASDCLAALGYYVPGTEPHIKLEFLDGLPGYIWVFPRQGHLSIGIGGKGASAQQFRAILERWMDEHGYDWRKGTFYAHKLPSLETASWRTNRVAGDRWLAAGDAAGFVDPITGEGIYYAIRSGELAARVIADEAIAEDAKAEAYRSAIEADFICDLQLASRVANRVYTGRFLGAPISRRALQFTRRSPLFRELMQDLFAGTQDYLTLRSRVFDGMGRTLRQVAWSFLDRSLLPLQGKT